MINKIKELLETTSVNHISTIISKDNDIIIYLCKETKKFNHHLTIMEMIYLVLHPEETPFCDCEKKIKKNFISIHKGYRKYCGTPKQCSSHMNTLMQYKKNNKEKIINKTKQTNIERYGVENVFQSEEIKEKSKRTNIKKYGVEYPSRSNKIRNKIKETCLEKYGVEHNWSDPNCREKCKNTTKEKYGKEFYSQTDDWINKVINTNNKNLNIDWVMQLKETKNKSKKTNLEKYGVENAIQSDEIKNKIKQNNLVKYGVEHYSQTNEYKNKIVTTCMKRYRVKNPNQKHFNIETIELLNNKDKFIELYEKNSIITLSKLLNIDGTTIQNYAKKYGCYVRYSDGRSSYEKEIESILSELNINYVTNDRSIIKPKELDFFLPDHNLAIEFNGNYWHSIEYIDKSYHFNKWKLCKEQNINLISIFEDEWILNKELIINRILYLCGIKNYNEIPEIDGNIIKGFLTECTFNELKKHNKKLTLLSNNRYPNNYEAYGFKLKKILPEDLYSSDIYDCGKSIYIWEKGEI